MKLVLLLCSIFATIISLTQSYETFFDDFNNNENDWYEDETSKKKAVIDNGFYSFESFEKDRLSIVYKEILIDASADYTIESSIKLEKGSKKLGYGMVLGFYNWENYARVLISENGLISMYQKINNKVETVLDWKKVSRGVLKGKGQYNHFKIEKNMKSVKVYINGQMVFETQRLKFIGKDFGFMLTDQQKITVDYLRIKRLNKPINLVQNPTSGSKIENLGPNVNSEYVEKGPIISVDGKTLYFTVDGEPNTTGNLGRDDVAFSKMDIYGKWTTRQFFPYPINNTNSNFIVSIAPDENSALFGNSYFADGSMGKGVSFAVKRNGEWLMPSPLQIQNFENVNGYANYFLSPDGGHLLMAIENKKSNGGLDLFVSFKQASGNWSEPQNMGTTLNTFSDDFSPFIAADGKTMFFSSYGHPGYGSADIFMTKRLDETWLNWSEPQNVGDGINTQDWDAYFGIDAQGNFGYMVSTGKDAIGNEDIFQIKLGEGIKPEPLDLISGNVYNAKTNELIDAQVIYEDLHTGNQLGTSYSTMQDGFKIVLPRGHNYGFQATAPGYISVSNNLDLRDITSYKEQTIDLYLVPIETGQDFTLSNIFFEGSTSNLAKESYLELDRLVEMMKNNPSIKIEIHSNMINAGLQANQIDVLKERITAIQNYIQQMKIEASRIKMEFEEIKFKPSLEINQNGEIRIKLF